MLLFVACLIGQFEPSKGKDVSAADFVQKCEDYKDRFVELEVERAERGIKANRGRGPVVLSFKKYLAELKKFSKDDGQLPQYPLRLSELNIGEIGYPSFVFLGQEHNGFAGSKVLQVLDESSVLCVAGDKVFVARGIETGNLVDDDAIAFPGVWKVSGRYSYTTTIGATKTVLAVSPWEHEQQFKEVLEERKKAAASDKKSSKPKS